MTNRKFLDALLEGLWEVRVRPMMGEYVLYCKDKVVGNVCDDTLFVKITPSSKRILEPLQTPVQPPYPGAKDYFKVESTEKAFLQELLFAVADDLPLPKKRK